MIAYRNNKEIRNNKPKQQSIVVVRAQQQPKRKTSQKKQKRPKSKMPSVLAPLARLVADPCNAELVQGLYGQHLGYISRFKSVHSATSTGANFMFLINPYSFANTAAAANPIEGFSWTPATDGTALVNTVANPLGTTAATSGSSFRTGGSDFVKSSSVSKARTVSCCVRLIYTGTTSNCAGRVAYLENINSQQILDLPTNAQFFAMASKTERVTLDPMEVTYRPDEVTDSRPRETFSGAITQGTPSTSASVESQNSLDLDPKWIGFVVDGIDANNFTFEVIRVIEWMPGPISGIVQSAPVSSPPNMVGTVLSA